MDFFGMGMGEILLIIIVALIIFGPGKVPEIARQLGKVVHTLKNASSELTTQITRELDEEEAAKRTHYPNTTDMTDTIVPPPVLPAPDATNNIQTPPDEKNDKR